MKQRLLLALLVLFASVGMSKAADIAFVVKLPANSGNVKITVTGTITADQKSALEKVCGTNNVNGNTITCPTTGNEKEYDFGSLPSISWTALTMEGIVSEITIKEIPSLTSLTIAKNGQLASLSLALSNLSTLNCEGALASSTTSLDVSGCTNLETINCSKNSLTSITLTELVRLKKLDCSDNQLATLSLPASTSQSACTVDCSGNKITNLISLPDKFSVIYGYQYIDATSATINANKAVNIKSIASACSLWGLSEDNFINDRTITCGAPWQKQNATTKAWSTTGEAKQNNPGTYPNDYVFHTGTIYTKGTYRFSVQKEKSPLKFYVCIPVKAAKIPVKYVEANKINDKVAGSLLINGTALTDNAKIELEAGSATSVTTAVASGLEGKVEFDKYELSPGVSVENGKVTASGLVSAKEVSIRPLFKAKKFKVTYTGPSSTVGGSYTITINGSPIQSGAEVDYGATLEIRATVNDGYEVSATQDGKNLPLDANNKAKVIVENNLSLGISIIQKAGSTTFTIGQNFSELKKGASAMSIGGKEVTIDSPESFNATFTPNSTIRISLKPVANVAIKEITVANTAYTPTLNSDSYVADIVVPAVTPAAIHIVFTNLETITAAAKPNVTYTYNGAAQPFQYVTTPAGLTMTKIEYSKDDGSNWSTTAPTDVLFATSNNTVKAYKVRLSRSADSNYAAIALFLDMTIRKAIATITTPPTVEVINTNGVQTYSIKNGKANTAGEFHVTKAQNIEINDQKDIVPDALKGQSHLVEVSFFAKNGDKDNTNYDCIGTKLQIPVKGLNDKELGTAKISTVSPLPAHVSALKIYNGNVELKSPATVAIGTTLIFAATVEEGVTKAEIMETKAGASAINKNTTPSDKQVTGTATVSGNMEVTTTVEYTVPKGKKDFHSVTPSAQTKEYTGSVIKYDESKGIEVKDEDGTKITSDLRFTISYKDAAGKEVSLPIDAGIYTVTVNVSHDDYNDKTVTTTLEVQQATPKITTWPKASPIAKKQTLQQSALSGGASSVAGIFSWKEPTATPTNGGKYEVVFIPADTKNYVKVTTPSADKVTVTVSDKMLITYGNIVNGTLKVKDAEGYEYQSGTEIKTGKVLTITATPNESFELETLTLNGQAIPNGSTYKVKDESIALSALFKLKTPHPASIVITLPENGKGYKLNANGAKRVDFNASYSFTISTLAADKKKLVVSAGGETLKANTDGSYTVKGDKDKSVVVILNNPTKIKVSVEQQIKNSKGFTLGKVEVDGLASDSTCYYNDVITLVAYPESGVTLTGWSDATTNKDKMRKITVTSTIHLKPLFTEIPTGIEKIEGTKIYGVDGNIFVGCAGEATITIISMNGQSQRVKISGDTHIPAETGIYGVIFEKGTEVIRAKIVVR